MKLDGKAAVLTGAGGLLGRALAERFIAEGATGLVLCDDDPGPSENHRGVAAVECHGGRRRTRRCP